MMAAAIPVLIALAFCAAPALAEEAQAPEQRLSAIEQRYMAGQRSEADDEAKAWIKADGEKMPWPWIAAASLRFHEKRYNKCLSLAETALEKAPQNAEAYYWRGRCFEAKGNVLDAANEYRAALKAEAAHPGAHEGLARLQPSLGAVDGLPRAN